MRGITEERLVELMHSALTKRDVNFVYQLITNECTKLKPLQPIDENTPKDRRLNLYWKGYGWYTGSWRMNQYWCDAGLKVPANIKPTHWQELPEDPIE